MQEKHLGRAARFEEMREETCDRFIVEEGGEHEATPRPGEVLVEIGIAVAAFLSLAVFADLFVVAICAG